MIGMGSVASRDVFRFAVSVKLERTIARYCAQVAGTQDEISDAAVSWAMAKPSRWQRIRFHTT